MELRFDPKLIINYIEWHLSKPILWAVLLNDHILYAFLFEANPIKNVRRPCRMRIILKFIIALLLCSLAVVGLAVAKIEPPAEGGTLPEIVLSAPENSELQQYLGVAGKKTFTIPEIKSEVVIVEIFSMY
jgi:hypothetical protein